jgi:hypothetical protein
VRPPPATPPLLQTCPTACPPGPNPTRQAAAREERRRSAEEFKANRERDAARDEAAGAGRDVDFIRMIRNYRAERALAAKQHMVTDARINICVRKRPISKRELKLRDWDSVTCVNPIVVVHASKVRRRPHRLHQPPHFPRAHRENSSTTEQPAGRDYVFWPPLTT